MNKKWIEKTIIFGLVSLLCFGSLGRPELASAETGNILSSFQRVPAHPKFLKTEDNLKANSITPFAQLTSRSAIPNKAIQPQLGTQKALAIMLEFSDIKFSGDHSEAYFTGLLFGNAPQKSMSTYFGENSYQQFNLTGTVAPKVCSTRTLAYYGSDFYPGDDDKYGSIDEMAREAVQLLDQQGFDFSSFDQDKDGKIDHLIIIHAGNGQEGSGVSTDIWSHHWEIGSGELVDGVTALDYATVPETAPLGTLAHEFAHDLGLPDLYDTINGDPINGTWDLMDYGAWGGPIGSEGTSPSHLSAWSKQQLGWVIPVNITADQLEAAIPAAEVNATVYRLWTNGATGNEYFLIENRQQLGFDADLPGSGLLIWHIEDNQGSILYNDVNNYSPLRVSLEQADGWNDLGLGDNVGDAGDPFPGQVNNQDFTRDSTPNSNNYTDQSSYVEVNTINDDGPIITANLTVQKIVPNGPVLLGPTGAEVPLKPLLQWRSVTKLQTYEVQVSTTADFSNRVVEQTGLTSSEYQLTTDLTADTAYYWRVRGTNLLGAGSWTNGSFTTLSLLNAVSLTPNPYSPAVSGFTTLHYELLRNAVVSASVYSGITPLVILQPTIAQVPGSYSLNWDGPPGAAGNGYYQVKLEAWAADGTYQNKAIELLVDTVVPAVPTMDPLASSTTNSSVSIAGQATDAQRVEIVVGQANPITINVAGNGKFSGTVALQLGANQIKARAVDAAGNTSAYSAAMILIRNEPTSGGGGGGGGVVTTSPVTLAIGLRQELKLEAGKENRLEAFGGNVCLDIPQDAQPAGMTALQVQVVKLDTTALNPGLQPCGSVFNFGPDGTSFTQPVALTLPFTKDQLGSMTTEHLSIFTWDPQQNTWISVGGKVDQDKGTVTAQISHFSLYAVMWLAPNFTDLNGHWGQKEIGLLTARQIFQGDGKGKFEVGRNITRSEFSKIIVKAYGLVPKANQATTQFKDIKPTAWYADEVNLVVQAGIMRGYPDKTFRPEQQITRQEAASVLMGLLSLKTQEQDTTGLQQVRDSNNIAPWARQRVSQALQEGIFAGYPDGNFGPIELIRRDEAAMSLYRLLKKQGRI